MQKVALACLLALGLAGPASLAAAEETPITVRVISKDAKFIGTSMGGVRVILRDARTGERLAGGLTRGGTGDTERIMHRDRGRRARLAGPSAAKFETTLELEEPRLIEAEAYGPLAQPQAAHRASSTQWVVPGRGLSAGDGWVLELPGFVVDVLAPAAHTTLKPGTRRVRFRANIAMMCGCPVTPGGIWDADQYEVKAVVRKDGGAVQRVDLDYAGSPSRFAGTVNIPGPGTYNAYVFAYDPQNGNTGVDRTSFLVPRE